RAAVIARENAALDAMGREARAIAEREGEGCAVREHHLLHVLLRGPAFDATLGAHFKVVGASLEDVDALVARHDLHHLIAATETGKSSLAPHTDGAASRGSSRRKRLGSLKRCKTLLSIKRHSRVKRIVEVLCPNIQPL